MRIEPPLSALLSAAYVAFIIELDNEFEHRMPHRTTEGTGTGDGPWLTSAAMWSTCMRYLPVEGITASELQRLAKTGTNLHGLARWGYIKLETGSTKSDPLVRPTDRGRKAQSIWKPLFGEIEERWNERFGRPEGSALRQALIGLAAKFDLDLPNCMPILGFALMNRDVYGSCESPSMETLSALKLPTLLARVLRRFTLDFESESDLSLAICANTLRVLNKSGVRPSDLPRLTGVSKETNQIALNYLEKGGWVEREPDPSRGRGQVAVLTWKGGEAQSNYRDLVRKLESAWRERYGKQAMEALRRSLEPLVGDGGRGSPLFQGLDPYPDGWRANAERPVTLPQFPIVSHRGGYPDGS